VVVELSPHGEAKVEEGTLVSALQSDLGVGDDHPIFVPSMIYRKGGRQVALHLMEGYVFIGSGLPETQYFGLEKRAYITQVMSVKSGPHRMRAPSVVPDEHILDLKKQLRELVSSDIEVGASVVILEGPYKGLEGEVLGLEGEDAFVHVELRSIEIIGTVPRVFLESQGD
jgi:transcription antitermination factor NusG